MIRSSIDWSRLETTLLTKTGGLSYSRDLRKMIENIRLDICELSKLEVIDRRNKTHKSAELTARINENIKMINEYILIAKLLG